MKPIFTLLFILGSLQVEAQNFWQTSFEADDTMYQHHLFIDTITYPDNIWQIGTTPKLTDTSFFGTSAIVTDTINYYPDNDTSVFYVYIPAFWGADELYHLTFWYKLDIDTGDYGLFELSRDSGQTWINYLDDTTMTGGLLPDFHSSTNGWAQCVIHYPMTNTTPNPVDSIFLRFTFISDNNPSIKNGWLIDRFFFGYIWQSVGKVENNNLISIYPNPSTGRIKIQSTTNTPKASIQIFNLNGQKVYETNTIPSSGNLDLPLPDGIYILKYSDEKETAVKRLLIQH